MNEIAICGTSYIGTACPSENFFEAKRTEIYKVLESASADSFKLERSWIRLGLLLSEFKAQECWRPLGYQIFDDFISELKSKSGRGRTQLYGYLGVAEALLPTISAEKLEAMGIAKALELKRALKALDGKPLPEDLINKALGDGTTKELRGDIGKALNLSPEPAGTWFDLDGIFLTAEERAEFKEVWKVSEALLGLTKEIPEHVRRKAVLTAWMREWYGTWAHDFYGKVNPECLE